MLSKEVASSIFKVFDIEPRYPGCLANTLLTEPMAWNNSNYNINHNNNNYVTVIPIVILYLEKKPKRLINGLNDLKSEDKLRQSRL